MPWFNVDDGFAFHRKAVKAGNAAIGLWTRAGSWCAQHLTDGLIEDHIVATMGSTPQAQRLVDAGLWIRVDGGYRFHEWSEEKRNPPREKVLEKRRFEAERKAKQRATNSGDEQVKADCPSGTDSAVPGGVPLGVRVSPPLPSLKEEKKKTSSSSPRTRGTRIPEDFTVSPEMVDWARAKTPTVDGRRETEKFINYWQAAAGQKAVKRDWAATWRNWMLTAAERAPSRMDSARASTTDQRVAAVLALARPHNLELPGAAS